MKCPYCGAKLADNAALCTRCNRFLDSPLPVEHRTPSTNAAKKPIVSRPASAKKEANKKNVLLLISWILGVLYAIYSIFYWSGAASGTSSAAEAIGAGIATALVMPHLICAVLAAIFNVLGWSMNSRGFTLTGAILYAVAMVMFPMYFMFVMIQTVLSFIGFAQLKKPGQ